MNLFLRGAALMMASASLAGCATITRGTTTEFTVESTPPAAAVKTSTGFTCVSTPCTFKMPRKEAFSVTVTKAGFKSSTTKVESKIAGKGAAGMAGNVLVGGIIGIGVDAASGAMNDLTPNPLKVTLDAEMTTAAIASAPAAAETTSAPAAAVNASQE